MSKIKTALGVTALQTPFVLLLLTIWSKSEATRDSLSRAPTSLGSKKQPPSTAVLNLWHARQLSVFRSRYLVTVTLSSKGCWSKRLEITRMPAPFLVLQLPYPLASG
jgi:hypothetical protein